MATRTKQEPTRSVDDNMEKCSPVASSLRIVTHRCQKTSHRTNSKPLPTIRCHGPDPRRLYRTRRSQQHWLSLGCLHKLHLLRCVLGNLKTKLRDGSSNSSTPSYACGTTPGTDVEVIAGEEPHLSRGNDADIPPIACFHVPWGFPQMRSSVTYYGT